MLHVGSRINDVDLDAFSAASVEVVSVRILRSSRFVRYVAQLLRSFILVHSLCCGIVGTIKATVYIDAGDLCSWSQRDTTRLQILGEDLRW